MKAELAKVKDALAESSLNETFQRYVVRDATLTAYNGKMAAGVPIGLNVEVAIPGVELERAIKRMPDDPKITYDNKGTLRLQCSPYSARIRVTDAGNENIPQAKDLKAIKINGETLFRMCKLLRPCLSSNAVHSYSLCINILEDGVFVTNNIVLIEYLACPIKQPCTLPIWLVEYVLKQGNHPTKFLYSDNFVGFMYADKSWVVSHQLRSELPSFKSVMAQYVEPAWKIPAEWRSIISTAAISADYLDIAENFIEVRTALSEFRAELKTPVDRLTAWQVESLIAVLESATHWDPNRYPAPTSFYGPDFRGVMVGYK